MRILSCLFSLVLLGGLFSSASAADETVAKKKIVRVLAVGNSFALNTCRFINDLNKDDSEHEVQAVVAYIGGCSFQTHIKLAELHEANPDDPKGKPYPNKTGKGDPKAKLSLKELLLDGPWDIITIQQASWLSPKIETYHPYAKQLYDYIKKYAPKPEIVVHQTWAYRVDDPVFKDGFTQEDMYNKLTKNYRDIAAELGNLRIINVGDGFYNARHDEEWGGYKPVENLDLSSFTKPNLPDQSLSLNVGYQWKKQKDGTEKISMDGHHACFRGEYLGGLIWYEFLTGKNAETFTFTPKGMTEEEGKILRRIAHQTVVQEAARFEALDSTMASSAK